MNVPLTLRKKILISYLRTEMALYLQKLESPSLQGCFVQGLSGSVEENYKFSHFRYYLPLERAKPFI